MYMLSSFYNKHNNCFNYNFSVHFNSLYICWSLAYFCLSSELRLKWTHSVLQWLYHPCDDFIMGELNLANTRDSDVLSKVSEYSD
jgi:hypothetical protein